MINRRTSWISGADRDDGERFIMRKDGKLTAFSESKAAR